MGSQLALLHTLLLVTTCLALAPKGPWDRFNFAPESRIVRPLSIKHVNGTVSSSSVLVDHNATGLATLQGGSWIALDFGKEVGGLITLNLGRNSPNAALALAFTESPLFIGPNSDDSSVLDATETHDGSFHLPMPLPTGSFTMPSEKDRGGFRYLTLIATGKEAVRVGNITLDITFMPHWDDLRAYTGYFFAEEEDFLNLVWYAGAYTVQTDTISSVLGRVSPAPPPEIGWLNNGTIGLNDGPILVDGAKRDRTVWPGDMEIAVPTQFVSTFDLLPTKNGLAILFSKMNPETGMLPYSGPEINAQGSDTYHEHTLIGVYNYWHFTGDLDFVKSIWANYTRGVGYLVGLVDNSGLMETRAGNDWARQGQSGHNIAANSLYNRVLVTSAALATALNDTDLASAWLRNATTHKQVINDLLWDETAGLYRDNETTTLHPQDGNSFAILYDIPVNSSQIQRISQGLTQNWNDIGPVSPELPDTISPFISGFELQAHFASGNDQRAMDLLHRTWGYMLTTNLSVQSTMLEGFQRDGSVLYYDIDPSYTSHAHGWSTGPTSALTFYVLGLTVTSPQGQTWQVAPHPSGLAKVEGGFETSLGWFGVKWSIDSTGTMTLTLDMPNGTSGNVVFPSSNVTVDNHAAQSSTLKNMSGGKHVIVRKVA